MLGCPDKLHPPTDMTEAEKVHLDVGSPGESGAWHDDVVRHVCPGMYDAVVVTDLWWPTPLQSRACGGSHGEAPAAARKANREWTQVLFQRHTEGPPGRFRSTLHAAPARTQVLG